MDPSLALKLLYVRRHILYVDHLVFALHAQSALFALLVACRVANVLGLGQVIPGMLTYILAFLLGFPTYMFFALRRFYRQAWWKNALKAVALAFLYIALIQPVMGLAVFFVVLTL